VNPGAREG